MTQTSFRVLLVEDSNLVSGRIAELINSAPGMEVVDIVTTESEATRLIREITPDAVVLDLRLKEGTGFGVLRSLKEAAQLPTVIVITNYALPQYRTEAMLLGAKFFLDKVQDMDELPPILSKLRYEKSLS